MAVVALVAVLPQPVVAEPAAARYPLTYPAAQQFCPPVDGFFDEVERTIDRVRGRMFERAKKRRSGGTP